jgi:hypothetical protein
MREPHLLKTPRTRQTGRVSFWRPAPVSNFFPKQDNLVVHFPLAALSLQECGKNRPERVIQLDLMKAAPIMVAVLYFTI